MDNRRRTMAQGARVSGTGLTSSVSRRAVLGGTAGVLGAAWLAGCSSGGGSGGSGNGDGDYVAPTYQPFADVEPDLPGTEDGVSPAFFAFPNPPADRDGFPLPETEAVSALLQGAPPTTAPDKNKAYEVFRKQAGNQMKATTVTSADYLDKYQVTLAGNELPDFVQMSQVPQFPKLLEKHFTDLTDVLGGDKVLEYPALANIPPPTWDIAKVNGRLWGIAQPRPPAGRILSTRGDILSEAGVDPNPEIKSGEDFVDLLAELTDRKNNRFAMGADPTAWLLPGLLEMLGAPNGWRVEDGTWINQHEAPETKEALNEAAKIVKAGYLHPNSFSDPAQNSVWWEGGTTAMYFQSFTGWGVFARSHPDWKVGYVRLPKWDGGGEAPIHKGPAGYGAFISIKKQDSDDRLAELLRLADLIASPFGTQQFLDVTYGAEGTTYEMKDGNPEYLPDQNKNVVAGWGYCGGNAQAVLFAPGQDDLIKSQHSYLSEVIPEGVDNPAEGLYSETDLTDGSKWRVRIQDTQRAILIGDSPVSEWDTLVKDWKADVGDKVAEELAESAAQQ